MAPTTSLLRSDRRPSRERRRSPRYALRPNDTGQGHYQATFRRTRAPLATDGIHDISEGGLSFMTRSRVPPRAGEFIGIDLAFPHFGPIAFQGKVVRVEPQGSRLRVGVEFLDLPGPYQDRLRRQVEQRLMEAEKGDGEPEVRWDVVASRPHLQAYLQTGRDLVLICLGVVAFYLLLSYLKQVNASMDWVNDAYMFFSRIKAP